MKDRSFSMSAMEMLGKELFEATEEDRRSQKTFVSPRTGHTVPKTTIIAMAEEHVLEAYRKLASVRAVHLVYPC